MDPIPNNIVKHIISESKLNNNSTLVDVLDAVNAFSKNDWDQAFSTIMHDHPNNPNFLKSIVITAVAVQVGLGPQTVITRSFIENLQFWHEYDVKENSPELINKSVNSSTNNIFTLCRQLLYLDFENIERGKNVTNYEEKKTIALYFRHIDVGQQFRLTNIDLKEYKFAITGSWDDALAAAILDLDEKEDFIQKPLTGSLKHFNTALENTYTRDNFLHIMRDNLIFSDVNTSSAPKTINGFRYYVMAILSCNIGIRMRRTVNLRNSMPQPRTISNDNVLTVMSIEKLDEYIKRLYDHYKSPTTTLTTRPWNPQFKAIYQKAVDNTDSRIQLKTLAIHFYGALKFFSVEFTNPRDEFINSGAEFKNEGNIINNNNNILPEANIRDFGSFADFYTIYKFNEVTEKDPNGISPSKDAPQWKQYIRLYNLYLLENNIDPKTPGVMNTASAQFQEFALREKAINPNGELVLLKRPITSEEKNERELTNQIELQRLEMQRVAANNVAEQERQDLARRQLADELEQQRQEIERVAANRLEQERLNNIAVQEQQRLQQLEQLNQKLAANEAKREEEQRAAARLKQLYSTASQSIQTQPQQQVIQQEIKANELERKQTQEQARILKQGVDAIEAKFQQQQHNNNVKNRQQQELTQFNLLRQQQGNNYYDPQLPNQFQQARTLQQNEAAIQAQNLRLNDFNREQERDVRAELEQQRFARGWGQEPAINRLHRQEPLGVNLANSFLSNSLQRLTYADRQRYLLAVVEQNEINRDEAFTELLLKQQQNKDIAEITKVTGQINTLLALPDSNEFGNVPTLNGYLTILKENINSLSNEDVFIYMRNLHKIQFTARNSGVTYKVPFAIFDSFKYVLGKNASLRDTLVLLTSARYILQPVYEVYMTKICNPNYENMSDEEIFQSMCTFALNSEKVRLIINATLKSDSLKTHNNRTEIRNSLDNVWKFFTHLAKQDVTKLIVECVSAVGYSMLINEYRFIGFEADFTPESMERGFNNAEFLRKARVTFDMFQLYVANYYIAKGFGEQFNDARFDLSSAALHPNSTYYNSQDGDVIDFNEVIRIAGPLNLLSNALPSNSSYEAKYEAEFPSTSTYQSSIRSSNNLYNNSTSSNRSSNLYPYNNSASSNPSVRPIDAPEAPEGFT